MPWQPPRTGRVGSAALRSKPLSSKGRVPRARPHARHGTHHAPADTAGRPLLTLAHLDPECRSYPTLAEALALGTHPVARPLVWVTPSEACRLSVSEPSWSSLTAGQAAPRAAFRANLTCDRSLLDALPAPSSQRVVHSLVSSSTPSALRRPEVPARPVLTLPLLFLWLSTSCHFSHMAAPQNLPLVCVAVPQQLNPQTREGAENCLTKSHLEDNLRNSLARHCAGCLYLTLSLKFLVAHDVACCFEQLPAKVQPALGPQSCTWLAHLSLRPERLDSVRPARVCRLDLAVPCPGLCGPAGVSALPAAQPTVAWEAADLPGPCLAEL